MGRLQALIAASTLAALLAGCDTSAEKEPPLAPKERSQAVVAQPGTTPAPATPTATAAAVATPKAHAAPRNLCSGRLERSGKIAPKGGISHAQAAGQAALPGSPELHEGLNWVNFWAAWCVPCKEEIPRLLGWERQLKAQGKAFHVVFVSLDDDPRQLQDFLDAQKPDGLRATYWLRDGTERASWLKAVGIKDDPELPAHVLVDGKGEVECTVRGAIEDGDYSSLLALMP